MKQFLNKTYCFFPLLLLCCFYCIKAINFPVHDFANYYFGGKFLLNGTFGTDIYFPHLFNLKISDLGYYNIFGSYAPNTPFLALIFAPISLMKLSLAKILLNIFSSLLLIISIYKLSVTYKLNKYAIILIPFLFFVPFKNNILFGQLYFVLFFLLTEFWLAYTKKQFTKSSLFLSIAIMLKIFPIIFIAFFLFKKQFKPLIICGLSCMILIVVTSFFTGYNIWLFWFSEVFSRASNGEIAGAFVDNYQSIFMFLKRTLVYDATENTFAFFNTPVLFKAIILGLKTAVFGIGFYYTNKKNNILQMLSFWVLASLFLSPYGSTYSFITLIFVAIFILKTEAKLIYKLLFFISLFFINNLPTPYFLNLNFPLSYLRLFCLIVLVVLFFVITKYRILNNRILALAPIFIVVSIFYLKIKTKVSSPILESRSPILIYDYKLNDNSLEYVFWDQNGETKQKISYPFSTIKKIELKNNQIFYNDKELTTSISNKLKPILIDNKKIIFLSDADRGIGFYTLKELKLKK